MNKLKTFKSSFFIDKSHFEEDGAQNYLVFQPLIRYIKLNGSTVRTSSWKSKRLSSETFEPPSISNISVSPQFSFYGAKMRVEFTGSYLKQSKILYTHKKVVNIYIVYELGVSGSNNSDPTLKMCLFGAVTLTKNAGIDKYGYSGYEIGFDRKSSFSFPRGGFGQNVLIFGADMSFSSHIGNKKNKKLVIGKGPTQELEHTLTAKKCISLILLQQKRNFA